MTDHHTRPDGGTDHDPDHDEGGSDEGLGRTLETVERNPLEAPTTGAGDGGAGVSRRTFVRTAGAGIGGLALGGAAGNAAAIPTPRLHTEGRWIRDPDGNDVELRGMAIADLGFYRRFHPKSFQEVLDWATDEGRGWHPNVVRLPLTKDSVDHFGLETYVTDFVRPAVDYLRARDVYALVDYHLIRPYTQAATETYNSNNDDTLDPIDDVMTTFWDRVAPEFADDEHVVYELFNEPTQPAMYGDDAGAFQTWRDAAQPWVDLVRSHAPETPIVIGSPRWTSVTHMAPEYPFDGENLIHAAHIYPANGAPSEFDQYYGQPANDVPVVVTEFGWDPSGGSVDQGTTSGWGQPFRDWVTGYSNVGWISWCFDDSWAPTFFDSPGSGAAEPWTLEDGADEMGGFVRSWLSETRNDSIPSGDTDDATAPPAPSNLTVDRVSEVTAEVSWDAVTDTGGSGLTNYNVYLDGSVEQQVVSGTAATISGLQPSSSYEVAVSAEDGANNESSRTSVVVETVATDAQQTAYVDHQLPGTIQAEDFDQGGQGIAYYDTTPANQGGSTYRQTAVDLGSGAPSGTNVGYVEPGEWLEYTVDVQTAGTYVIRVNAASGSNSGGDVRIELDRSEIGTHGIWPTGGWTSYQEMRVGTADLPAGEHILRVYAETAGWNLDYVDFALQSASGDTTAPTAPSNLSVTGTSSTSVDVSWSAASDSGGSGLDHYDVYVDGSLDQQVAAGTTSATVSELSAGTSYEIAVAAVDGAGNESGQVSTTATTDSGGDTTAPTTPANLSVSGTTTSSADVSWDASTDSGTGVDHYTVYVDGSQDHTVAAGTTSTTVSGLSAGTGYSIGVSAVDGAGNESSQATVTATTESSPDASAPTAPSNLTASGTTSTSIDVAWDASTDSGGSGLDHYVVSVDGSQDQTVGASAGSTAATVSDLSADTSYTVGVSAVDGAGNESPTTTVTATTDADGDTGDALVVNDYDGSPAWPGGNDLGNWAGAGSFQNGGGSGEVVGGALELQYDDAGWFVEQVMQDVSDYSSLVFEVGGASGGEGAHCSVELGTTSGTFADLAGSAIGTSTSAVSIDVAAAGFDQASPGELRLNFWEGGSGSSTLTIEEIRFE